MFVIYERFLCFGVLDGQKKQVVRCGIRDIVMSIFFLDIL